MGLFRSDRGPESLVRTVAWLSNLQSLKIGPGYRNTTKYRSILNYIEDFISYRKENILKIKLLMLKEIMID